MVDAQRQVLISLEPTFDGFLVHIQSPPPANGDPLGQKAEIRVYGLLADAIDALPGMVRRELVRRKGGD